MSGKFIALTALCLTFPLFSSCGGKKGTGAITYEFVSPSRGSLERTVSAPGTLNPVSIVKVLPRMNGKVEEIFVDFNAQVKAGDVLAVLNTDMLQLQRQQQAAAVAKARAHYELQRVNYQNQQELAESNFVSEYDLRSARTSLDVQAADLTVAEANLKVIETEINQYAFITSPIDGIVLERNISVGDTVVSSSSSVTASIFTLAENLREMRIEAVVGELDIASIHEGQEVRFTLESLPGRRYTGTVETVRLVPSVQNNVVSYTVIIGVENHDGALLPGMTCAVEFIVGRSENILMIPNTALRYQPSHLSSAEIAEIVFNAALKDMDEEQRNAAVEARARAQAAAPGQSPSPGTGLAGLVGGNMGRNRPPGMGRPQNTPGGGSASGRTAPITLRNLWYLNGEGKPETMQVQAGISNGSFTEIRSAENIEGMRFILREKL